MQQPVGAQVAQNAERSTAHNPIGGPASFADLAARLEPAVVNISTTQRVKVPQQNNPFAGTPFDDLFKQFGGGAPGGDDNGGGNGGKPATREAMSLGSGFVISADGFIVTNNHVIAGGDPNDPSTKGATLESVTVTLLRPYRVQGADRRARRRRRSRGAQDRGAQAAALRPVRRFDAHAGRRLG